MMPRKRKKQVRRLPAPRSSNRGTLRLAAVLAVLVAVNLYVFLWRGGTSIPDVMERAAVAGDLPGSADAIDDDLGPVVPGAELQEQDEPSEEPIETGTWADGLVQPNDGMSRILAREGLDNNQIDKAIRAMRPHIDFRKIKPGQTYRVHRTDENVWDGFEFHVSRIEKVIATAGADGQITAEKIEADTEIRRVHVGGRIESSLYMAIKDSGEDTALVERMVDVFAYDLNFYIDQHKGDTYKLIVEKEYLNGEFLRYRGMLAAEWKGRAGTFRAFRWKPPKAKKAGYYDSKGRSLVKTFLKSPLKYTRISSKFNRRRMHPILHKRRGHMGVDYAAPTGTPIWAAASGKITFRGRRGGAGNCVIVRHDNGLSSIYMHLSKFRKGQKVGARIRQKQVIGYVGMTGLATGPHLHFGVKKNGRYIDPMKMKMARGRPIPKAERPSFETRAATLLAELSGIAIARAAEQPSEQP